MMNIDTAYEQARQERIVQGKPLTAPPDCTHCVDENDCQCVAICPVVAETYKEGTR